MIPCEETVILSQPRKAFATTMIMCSLALHNEESEYIERESYTVPASYHTGVEKESTLIQLTKEC